MKKLSGHMPAKAVATLLNHFVISVVPEARCREAFRRCSLMGATFGINPFEHRSGDIDALVGKLCVLKKLPEITASIKAADADRDLVDGFIVRAFLRMNEIESSNVTYLFAGDPDILEIFRRAMLRGPSAIEGAHSA